MKLRALRDMDYGTRRLKAGDTFVAQTPSDAEALKVLQAATDADVQEYPQPARTARRRRLPKTEAKQPEPKPEPESEALEEKTVPELREMAKEEGIDLPPGYVRKDELVDLLEQGSGESDFLEDK